MFCVCGASLIRNGGVLNKDVFFAQRWKRGGGKFVADPLVTGRVSHALFRGLVFGKLSVDGGDLQGSCFWSYRGWGSMMSK